MTTNPNDGRRRGVTITTREVPQMRRCLAEGHDHDFLTIKSVRICGRGRDALRSLDPLYGSVGSLLALRGSKGARYSAAGIAAYATETT